MPKVGKPRKRGNGYEVNWTDGSGKRRFKTLPTHAAAVKFLRARQAEADAVRVGALEVVEVDRTWPELVELWYEVKHAKRTLGDDKSRIRIHLTPAFGSLKLVDITPRRISRLERDVGRRVSVGTVRQVLSLLRSMLRLAVEHGWLAKAPKIRLPKAQEMAYQWIRSEEAMQRLLLAARETEYPGLVELYAMALYTGMRAGELCGLRWADVDLENRLITVQRSWDEQTTKSSEIRRVPILDPLLPLLTAWKLRCHSRELVFPNKRGNMHVRSARVMHQTYTGCLEKAGIDRIRFHDLRHTFASHWMLKGGDLYRLQKILGHKSIAMTQRYAHLSPSAFQQDWGRFGDFTPPAGEVLELQPSPRSSVRSRS